MLGIIEVTTILLILILDTFPIGYVILRLFAKKTTLELSFFALFPIYISIGLAVVLIIGFLSSAVGLSRLTLILLPVIPYVLILNDIRNSPIKRNLSGKISSTNIVFLILIAFVFFYFARIPVATLWPPVGDAIWHSTLTSLAIHNNHVPVNLEPIDNFNFPYPSGFHILAANLSLLTNAYPAEIVYVLGAFLLCILACLLASLSFILTKSIWLTLPAPFSVVVAHSSNQMETWMSGYLFNGPYPTLFGFVSILTVICIFEIATNRKPINWFSIPTTVVIILALLVTYPNFIFQVVIFSLIYLVSIALRAKINGKSIDDLEDTLGPRDLNPQSTSHNQSRLALVKSNLVCSTFRRSVFITIGIVGIFFLTSWALGLIKFYEEMYYFFSSEFSKYQAAANLSPATVLPLFKSDLIFNVVIISTAIIYVVVFFKRSLNLPLFIGWMMLLVAVLFGISFIYPLRTLALIFVLCWPLLAYSLKRISQERIVLRVTLVSGFLVIALVIQGPHIAYQFSHEPGWFLVLSENFKNTYEMANWVVTNVPSSTRILNDPTYSSLYLEGFSIKNLTYDYWNGLMKPTGTEYMQKELSRIWKNPYDEDEIHFLLQRYNIGYIVITSEGGYVDYVNWGGQGRYISKPFNNVDYMTIFNTYPFLHLDYKSTNQPYSLVYSVVDFKKIKR